VIEFQLHASSGVATYLQLIQQVRHAMRLGPLRPGDQLPTARVVVERSAINPNTVLKAYRELERWVRRVSKRCTGPSREMTFNVTKNIA
jgi:GntR family transcriptional regulator